MNHPTEIFWRQYALTDELTHAERATAEEHLYQCETCLALYIRLLEEAEDTPQLSKEGEVALTAALRGHRDVQKTGDRRRRRPTGRERRRALVHYVIAASLTLVFLSSGLLQDYLDHTVQPANLIQGTEQVENEQTITSRLMERTTDLLRAWKPSADEADRY
ncbi:hypothetical protein [Paenibacillus daejeonensis]|uniref:hypothetical protein n=1 Tax=Paenibacillus daejeonensis TaxID=135193 RepID=UPI00036393C5|nr:hypothetical protein [Paenibacillus daejeonensis]